MGGKRIKELDISRALSLLVILLYHTPNYTNYFDGWPIWHAINYVARWSLGAFVLCSGYLISTKYSFETAQSIRTFYKRRLFRIMPMFAISLFTWHPSHPVLVSLAALTGVINFIDMPNVFTLWFVAMIIVFYAIAPLLVRLTFLSTMSVAFILECLFWIGSKQLGWESRLWLYFPCFAFGSIIARLKPAHQQITAIAGAVMAFSIWFFWGNPSGPASILPPLFGSGALVCVAWIIGKARIFDKAFSIVAFSSMAAYIFHRQIFIFFRGIIGFPADGPLRAAEILLVCIPTILIAGFLIQKAYDRLLDAFLKAIRPKTLNFPPAIPPSV